MLVYHILVLAVLLILLGVALLNSRTFPRLEPGRRPKSDPTVSVLVPARNEERVIADCVGSLLRQDYGRMEILVLDDGSEDRTGEILHELVAGTTRIPTRILQGEPLPPGWLGKNRACARLAEAATGEWLLFIDADTTHAPGMVSAIVGEATRRDASFVSAVPRQLVPTFWEKVIVPFPPFLYFSYLPNLLIPKRNHPSLSAANGQMILVSREAYEAIGGHSGVRDQIVEDVRLARKAKQAGFRIELLRADRLSACRMYRSLHEIIEGFSKNLYPGLGGRPAAMIAFILHLLILFVVPWLSLVLSLVAGNGPEDPRTYLPAAQGVVGIIMRGLSERAFGMSPWKGILQPLSASAAVVIGGIAWRRWSSGEGARWKGRIYADIDPRAD